MIKLRNFIRLFIKSEHINYIEFNTNNDSWPPELRFPCIAIDDLLTQIYKYAGCDAILDHRVEGVNQIIPFENHAKSVNNIEQVEGHTLDRHNGLFLNGVDNEGRDVAVRVVPFLEIVLEYAQE